MSKIKLRVNSKGWFWLWLSYLNDGWPPVVQVWVGPSDTAADAYTPAAHELERCQARAAERTARDNARRIMGLSTPTGYPH